jgi:tetratricopeptide (TPR) repeat protein
VRTRRFSWHISWLALLAACLPVFAAGEAAAQRASPAPARAEAQRDEPGAMMSERAFRRFDTITKAYGDGRYTEAQQAAEAYLRSELNDHERAMGEQLLGYILIARERLDEAVPHFRQALALDALPNAAHFGVMRALAQLHAAQGDWQASIDAMNEYLRYQPEPTAEDGIMMGQSLAQLGRHRDALPWVRAAIERAGDKAQESWHQLELAMLFELRDYRAALRVLNALVARWPERLRYWEMMAGAHQELGQHADALAALMAAYHGGLLDEEAKLLNLVRLNMYVELPYQGGAILERALDRGQVDASKPNLELLLQAWIAAREFGRAAAVIERLAPLTDDGELYLQQARLMMEQNQWQATLDAGQKALERGNLAQPGAAWLLTGIALMELDRLREARQAFLRAQEHDPDARRQAREWQRFVEDRIEAAGLRAGG